MGGVGQLTPHLAVGLRTAPLLDNAASPPRAEGPGLLVLADDRSASAMTPITERRLAGIADLSRRRCRHTS